MKVVISVGAKYCHISVDGKIIADPDGRHSIPATVMTDAGESGLFVATPSAYVQSEANREELLEKLVSNLKDAAEAHAGCKVTECIVTVPPYCDSNLKNAFESNRLKATLVPELDCYMMLLLQGLNLIVDVSYYGALFALVHCGEHFSLLRTEYVEGIGSLEIDRAVAEFIAKKHNVGTLLDVAESVRKSMASSDSARYFTEIAGTDVTGEISKVRFDSILNRCEWSKRFTGAVQTFLGTEAVDRVLLIDQVPYIMNLVGRITKAPVSCAPDYCVALGAHRQTITRSGEKEQLDRPIGILVNQDFQPLLPRYTIVPCVKKVAVKAGILQIAEKHGADVRLLCEVPVEEGTVEISVGNKGELRVNDQIYSSAACPPTH